MKRKILVVLGLVAFLGVGLTGFATADEAGVSATVTAGFVAARVADGGVAFGTVDLNSTNDTIAGTAAETQTVFNDGSVTADLFLRSSDAIGSSVNWDLVACGSVGSEAYGHEFEVGNGDATFTGTTFPVDNSNSVDVGDLTAGNGNDATGTDQLDLDLKICTPTSTADAGVHTITVTAVLTAQ